MKMQGNEIPTHIPVSDPALKKKPHAILMLFILIPSPLMLTTAPTYFKVSETMINIASARSGWELSLLYDGPSWTGVYDITRL